MSLPAEIVDAHHHLWNLTAVDYPWLNARKRRFFGDPAPIRRDYGPVDFRADHDALPVNASVHIQVGAADPLAETRWLEGQRRSTGWPSAIVAEADLTARDLEARLDLLTAATPALRGIRQIIARHPSEDGPDGGRLLRDPAFFMGLRRLARRGLSFDLQLTAPHLERASEVFALAPGVPVALCHAGSPWDQTPKGLANWRAGLTQIAALSHVHVKLSGLGMFNPAWTVDTLRPLVESALDAFGPDRTMWGSNFPVDKLYRGYRPLLEAVAAIVPPALHTAVFSTTARTFYRL